MKHFSERDHRTDTAERFGLSIEGFYEKKGLGILMGVGIHKEEFTGLVLRSGGNLEMIEAARRAGASANFAGSGGAIVGLYEGDSMYQKIEEEMENIGVALIRPQIEPKQRA